MATILVVCSGNICRSPVAEGLLRHALLGRFGTDAPRVSSAGTIGLTGASATQESVEAAAERGTDIAAHVARRLTDQMIAEADVIVCMATEHRDEVAERDVEAGSRAFTLKELARLLEIDTPHVLLGPDRLTERVATAAVARSAGASGNPFDEDIVDPIGMPMETYRAIAWEIDQWTDRLVAGLFGPVPAEIVGEGT